MKFSSPAAVLNTLRTPGWHRARLLRRVAAAALVLLALVSAVPDTGGPGPRALVVARDISPGAAVTAEDFELLPVPPQLLPVGALQDPQAVEGRVAVASLQVGQVPTESAFIGAMLLAELLPDSAGEKVNLVPLRLAEPEIIPLLRHGDTVTVLSQTADSPAPEVVAGGARVVLAESVEDGDPGTVLVALPESAAQRVAAAALYSPLAVVLTGEQRDNFP